MSSPEEYQKAAKECIGERPGSRRGFVSTETLENIEESRAARHVGNQDQYRAMSPRTRTLLRRDKERDVRILAEDVEGYLNANDLRPRNRALKKLRFKSPSRASAIRAADGRFVSDMKGRWLVGDLGSLGFTPGKSATDRVLVLGVLVERRHEFQQGMLAAYVDLKKAFDSVHREDSIFYDVLDLQFRRMQSLESTVTLAIGRQSRSPAFLRYNFSLARLQILGDLEDPPQIPREDPTIHKEMAEVGERSGFPRHPRGGVAVVWEKARIPTQKKSRCVERILRLYASWQNLDRSKKRSAEVDVENRRSFSLALMTLFDIGHADAFDLITVDEDRQFLLASAARMDPVASCKESTNPWPTESDGVWSAAC
ncbi:hypothetical protein GWK47_041387 [Chionoecetes opilio]|uniref:Reverse transcriptase domain-containing protein n=1 Tax=Chionoecetes opilio TaxID=41210 RepID=A0A8J4YJ31_CHIOP|nr:hypothetical protein GWK47_041387 [Chionoecetes opilio]